jgi:hypothetical protein
VHSDAARDELNAGRFKSALNGGNGGAVGASGAGFQIQQSAGCNARFLGKIALRPAE